MGKALRIACVLVLAIASGCAATWLAITLPCRWLAMSCGYGAAWMAMLVGIAVGLGVAASGLRRALRAAR